MDCIYTGKEEYVCTKCGAVFQRPNPLKSHIRYHCSVNKSTSVTPCSSSPWINPNFPTFMPAPPVRWFSSLLPGFPAVWGASPLVITARAERSRDRAMTSYAEDVGATRNAGTWWLDCLQQILRTENNSATRTSKLRDVSGDATPDVTEPTSDVTTSAERTMTSSQVRAKARGAGGDGYVCPYCGKLYSRRYGLKIHVRTHTGFKPLQCPVCRRPFGDPSNLNKHIRLHGQSSASGDSTPYTCRHCDKVLVRRRDLDRHVRARHPDQLYPSAGDVSSNAANTDLVTSSECVSANDDRDDDDRPSVLKTKITT